MGSGHSKEGNFERSSSIRKTQKQQFSEIKKKSDHVSKTLSKLKKDPPPELYDKISAEVDEIRKFLEIISPEVQAKYNDAFDIYVDKIELFRKQLNEKFNRTEQQNVVQEEPVVPATPPVSLQSEPVEKPEVELKELQLSPSTPVVQDVKLVKPKKQKRRKSQVERLPTKEEVSVQELLRIREEMLSYRSEIVAFKGKKNDRLYHFLQETFHRFVKRLEDVQTYDNIEIKHERKAAITFARDSLTMLEQKPAETNLDRKSVTTFLANDNRRSSYSFKEYPQEEQAVQEEANLADFKLNLESKLRFMGAGERRNVGMVKASMYKADTSEEEESDDEVPYKRMSDDEIIKPKKGENGDVDAESKRRSGKMKHRSSSVEIVECTDESTDSDDSVTEDVFVESSKPKTTDYRTTPI